MRRTVLAEFLTIFALQIIFNGGTVTQQAKSRKSAGKMNFRSHFAPPKSAQILTNYISKPGKLIQIFEFGGA